VRRCRQPGAFAKKKSPRWNRPLPMTMVVSAHKRTSKRRGPALASQKHVEARRTVLEPASPLRRKGARAPDPMAHPCERAIGRPNAKRSSAERRSRGGPPQGAQTRAAHTPAERTHLSKLLFFEWSERAAVAGVLPLQLFFAEEHCEQMSAPSPHAIHDAALLAERQGRRADAARLHEEAKTAFLAAANNLGAGDDATKKSFILLAEFHRARRCVHACQSLTRAPHPGQEKCSKSRGIRVPRRRNYSVATRYLWQAGRRQLARLPAHHARCKPWAKSCSATLRRRRRCALQLNRRSAQRALHRLRSSLVKSRVRVARRGTRARALTAAGAGQITLFLASTTWARRRASHPRPRCLASAQPTPGTRRGS